MRVSGGGGREGGREGKGDAKSKRRLPCMKRLREQARCAVS